MERSRFGQFCEQPSIAALVALRVSSRDQTKLCMTELCMTGKKLTVCRLLREDGMDVTGLARELAVQNKQRLFALCGIIAPLLREGDHKSVLPIARCCRVKTDISIVLSCFR